MIERNNIKDEIKQATIFNVMGFFYVKRKCKNKTNKKYM